MSEVWNGGHERAIRICIAAAGLFIGFISGYLWRMFL